jgi:hypothetical protein
MSEAIFHFEYASVPGLAPETVVREGDATFVAQADKPWAGAPSAISSIAAVRCRAEHGRGRGTCGVAGGALPGATVADQRPAADYRITTGREMISG